MSINERRERPLTGYSNMNYQMKHHTPVRVADRSATRIHTVGRTMTPPLASSHHRKTSPVQHLETIDRMEEKLVKLQYEKDRINLESSHYKKQSQHANQQLRDEMRRSRRMEMKVIELEQRVSRLIQQKQTLRILMTNNDIKRIHEINRLKQQNQDLWYRINRLNAYNKTLQNSPSKKQSPQLYRKYTQDSSLQRQVVLLRSEKKKLQEKINKMNERHMRSDDGLGRDYEKYNYHMMIDRDRHRIEENELQREKKQLKDKDNIIEEQRSSIQTLKSLNDGQRNEIERLKKILDKHEKKVHFQDQSKNKDNVMVLKKQIEQLARDIEVLKRKNELLQSEKQYSGGEATKLKTQLALTEEKQKIDKKRLSQLTELKNSEMQKLKEQLEKVKRSEKDATRRLDTAKSESRQQIQEKKKEIDGLKIELSQLKDQKNHIESNVVRSLERKIEDLKMELENVKNRQPDTSKLKEALTSQLLKKQQQLKRNHQTQIENIRVELTRQYEQERKHLWTKLDEQMKKNEQSQGQLNSIKAKYEVQLKDLNQRYRNSQSELIELYRKIDEKTDEDMKARYEETRQILHKTTKELDETTKENVSIRHELELANIKLQKEAQDKQKQLEEQKQQFDRRLELATIELQQRTKLNEQLQYLLQKTKESSDEAKQNEEDLRQRQQKQQEFTNRISFLQQQHKQTLGRLTDKDRELQTAQQKMQILEANQKQYKTNMQTLKDQRNLARLFLEEKEAELRHIKESQPNQQDQINRIVNEYEARMSKQNQSRQNQDNERENKYRNLENQHYQEVTRLNRNINELQSRNDYLEAQRENLEAKIQQQTGSDKLKVQTLQEQIRTLEHKILNLQQQINTNKQQAKQREQILERQLEFIRFKQNEEKDIFESELEKFRNSAPVRIVEQDPAIVSELKTTKQELEKLKQIYDILIDQKMKILQEKNNLQNILDDLKNSHRQQTENLRFEIEQLKRQIDNADMTELNNLTNQINELLSQNQTDRKQLQQLYGVLDELKQQLLIRNQQNLDNTESIQNLQQKIMQLGLKVCNQQNHLAEQFNEVDNGLQMIKDRLRSA